MTTSLLATRNRSRETLRSRADQHGSYRKSGALAPALQIYKPINSQMQRSWK
jgi:hypothetical protein